MRIYPATVKRGAWVIVEPFFDLAHVPLPDS
jgi:hypothetical protein